LPLYHNQFSWWLDEKLTDAQRQEINRLTQKLAALKELNESMIAVLEEIKPGTIDQIMKKSDLELGLEFFMKQQKSDKKRKP
jgi:hypothetical protein